MARLAAAPLVAAAVLAACVAAIDPPVWVPESNRGLAASRLTVQGTGKQLTHYFQLAVEPVGTVVFFPGCHRFATYFFPASTTNCPECVGMPEHLSHTKQFLARGYNLLAMSNHDGVDGCWSSTDNAPYVNDQPMAMASLRTFLTNTGQLGRPVYLWGFSSGGTFALKMVGNLYRNDPALFANVKGVVSDARSHRFRCHRRHRQAGLPQLPSNRLCAHAVRRLGGGHANEPGLVCSKRVEGSPHCHCPPAPHLQHLPLRPHPHDHQDQQR